jgi:hypothetical protein
VFSLRWIPAQVVVSLPLHRFPASSTIHCRPRQAPAKVRLASKQDWSFLYVCIWFHFLWVLRATRKKSVNPPRKVWRTPAIEGTSRRMRHLPKATKRENIEFMRRARGTSPWAQNCERFEQQGPDPREKHQSSGHQHGYAGRRSNHASIVSSWVVALIICVEVISIEDEELNILII